MESERYQIVKYRPEFKNQLLKLQAHLWGRDQVRRAAYLEWKYDRNPFVNDIYIYVAFYDEQLVGMVGAYGVQWEVGKPSQLFSGLCFADLVILPGHRNRNLFRKLMTFALDELSETGYEYVFDLSAAPHVAAVLLMQGWRRIFLQTANLQTNQATKSGQMQENAQRKSWIASAYRQFGAYSRKLPMLTSTYHWLSRHVRDLFLRRSDKLCSAFTDFDVNAGRHEANPYVSFSKTSRPRAMAELAERIGTDSRIRHVRDSQYFSWRFQNPLSEYRFLFWEHGRLEGYLVLHTKLDTHSGDAWAYIVDWEATNEQVWADLLQAVIQWGSFKELGIWSATLSDDVKTLLREAGFTFWDKTGSLRHELQGENILVKPLRHKIQQLDWVLAGRDLLDPANWDLRMIYSDNY